MVNECVLVDTGLFGEPIFIRRLIGKLGHTPSP
jgi:hypothetical protein